MPSGKTHDRITLWSLPLVVGACYGLTRSGDLALSVGGSYLFSGLMFGPDLDIYSLQYKRWGIFRWIWRPYQKMLNHRSPLSHGFLIGTMVRVGYLMLILGGIALFFLAIAQILDLKQWQWHPSLQQQLMGLPQQHPQEAIAIFIGLELGAMSHSLSDGLGSAFRRFRPAKSKSAVIRRKNFKN
jgi:uncharacterized metal-binding protein